MSNQGTCGDCEYEKKCLRRGDLPTSNKVECPARTELRVRVEGCKTAWCDPIRKVRAERDELRNALGIMNISHDLLKRQIETWKERAIELGYKLKIDPDKPIEG